MFPVKIRKAEPNDYEIIAEYNINMAKETEDIVLKRETVLQGCKTILSDSSKGFYLVAENENREIIGQLMITYEWSDWRNGTIWWIQSVYVAEKYRRNGVYSTLYRHLEQMSEDEGNVAAIRLYVAKTNKRAQRTYSKQGMRESDYFIYEKDFVLGH